MRVGERWKCYDQEDKTKESKSGMEDERERGVAFGLDMRLVWEQERSESQQREAVHLFDSHIKRHPVPSGHALF